MGIRGIGVDIEPVKRFAAKPYPRHRAFYARLFTEGEIAYCLGKRDPAASFAGKFCAKEALLKALRRHNVFDVRAVEIKNNREGEPVVYFRPRKLDCFLSIAHEGEYAAAFCIVMSPT